MLTLLRSIPGLSWLNESDLLLAPSGAKAETFSRRGSIMSNGAVLTTATLHMTALPIRAGTVCTTANFMQATTAFTAATNQWAALLDSSRNVVRQSTDLLTIGLAANTQYAATLDSIPVTAGARVASTTVTLTIPTLSESLTALVATGDSIVVSNANIAAYNGTFTVTGVTATTITYTSTSATDSLVAPFPTVQLASSKKVYTAPATALYYLGIMYKGTVGTLEGIGPTKLNSLNLAPILNGDSTAALTGTCPSPAAAITSTAGAPYGWIT